MWTVPIVLQQDIFFIYQCSARKTFHYGGKIYIIYKFSLVRSVCLGTLLCYNITIELERMKRIFFSKIKMKKVLFLILLATLIQIVFYYMRDFMISISISLAVRGNPHLSLGMFLTSNCHAN